MFIACPLTSFCKLVIFVVLLLIWSKVCWGTFPLVLIPAIAVSTYAFVAGLLSTVGVGTNKLKRLVSVALAL